MCVFRADFCSAIARGWSDDNTSARCTGFVTPTPSIAQTKIAAYVRMYGEREGGGWGAEPRYVVRCDASPCGGSDTHSV